MKCISGQSQISCKGQRHCPPKENKSEKQILKAGRKNLFLGSVFIFEKRGEDKTVCPGIFSQ